MIENLLQNLDTLLIYVFGASALVAGALMIVLRHPMQVAMALISAMTSAMWPIIPCFGRMTISISPQTGRRRRMLPAISQRTQ